MAAMNAPLTFIMVNFIVSCGLWHFTRSFNHVCYYTTGGGPKALPVSQIDVQLCTHVIFGFVVIDPAGNINISNVGGQQGLLEFSTLKQRGPQVKLMLSVGGGGSDNEPFKQTVRSEEKTRRFIDSAIGVLQDAQLDGLDLDWEFPDILDRRPFSAFLQKVSAAFQSGTQGSFLLSVAVPAPSTLLVGYDVPAMARNVDFVNLMTYDLHIYKWYTPTTGHNSPLFKRSGELGYFATLNMESSCQLWTSNGMPKSKLMVGIPTFGLSWILLDANFNGVGALAIGEGEGGGDALYPQICELLTSGGTRHFDDESMVPFLTKNRTWISYDDQESVSIKARWMLAQNFSGAMTFSLNADDWQGACGAGAFPLHNSILEETC